MSVLSGSGIIHLPRPSRLLDHLQSRLRSPDIPLGTVRTVLAHYGLELTSSPRNLPNTRRNWNLIVHTSAGKRILKRYRPDWRTSTIAFEHSILNRLAELDSPAPRLGVTTDGKTYLTLEGHNYCLFDFIDGTNYSSSYLLRPYRLRMMAAAGQTLARIHQQLRGFLPEGRHHLGFKSYGDRRHRDMAWHVKKVDELKTRSGSLTEPSDRLHANWLIDRGDQILDELSWLDESLGDASLPRVIIHGDYGLHNLIFQGPSRAIPVDFELARLEWRLTDLVSVVSKFRYQGGAYDLDSVRCFIQAYGSECPISPDEWTLFPLVWKHHKLVKAVQYWASYFETGGPTRKLISARDEADQASWALHNAQRLSEFGAAP